MEYEFDWDEANLAHIRRHNVTPEEAEGAVTISPIEVDYQLRNGEKRIQMLGPTARGRLLSVLITFRSGKIRVVTAFSATRRQQVAYFQTSGFIYD
jgi:uncharacterized DUF497 family protein